MNRSAREGRGLSHRRCLRVLVVITMVALTALASPHAASAAVKGPPRVLPLGDSITHGYEHGSYRDALWETVADGGRQLEFVGSQQDGPGSLPDLDHEGHIGWRIDEVEAEAAEWVQEYAPDIVLLHIGTNDLLQGEAAEVMAERLETLMATLIGARPGMTLIVATLIPLHDSDDRWDRYNDAVVDLVVAQQRKGSDVVLASMGAVRFTDDDIPDGVHPGSAGYAKMAEVWYPLVAAALDARAAGQQPLRSAVRPPSTRAGADWSAAHAGRTTTSQHRAPTVERDWSG